VIARRTIRRAYDGELVVRTESGSLEALRAELKRDRRRSDMVIAAAAVFVGGIIWLALATEPAWIGWLLAGAGIAGLANRLRASAK
jgi:fatty acid desaturase